VSEDVYVSFTTTATTAGDATEGSASELLTPRQVRCTARFRPGLPPLVEGGALTSLRHVPFFQLPTLAPESNPLVRPPNSA